MVRCAEIRPSVRQCAHVRYSAGRASLAGSGTSGIGGGGWWTLAQVDPRYRRFFPCGWRNGSILCQRRPTSRTLRLFGWYPTPWGLRIAAVSDREVSRALIALSRFRDSLSSFFAWAVRERMIPTNPVTPTRVPKSSTPRTEMYPLARRSWRSSYSRAVQRDQRLADILLIDAWTGPPLVRAASRAGSRLHRSSAACLGGAARKGAYF